ncbi:MAG: capsule assembly Wzi family protein [Daejeonella sp.]
MKCIKSGFTFLIILFSAICSQAQSIPVGTVALEEYYRRAQLMGQGDSTISFAIRPLTFSSLMSGVSVYPDSVRIGYSLVDSNSVLKTQNGKLSIQLLPADWQLRFSSHHPYGWNDGPLIPARGFQTVISGGIYAEYGPLSIQLRPELVLAQNPSFRGFPTDENNVLWWKLYYDYYNYTDLPERFGKNSYTRGFWGQSSIRVNFEPFSFGISTENLWWGPGTRNSLLMSNTAPGFKHLTFNTTRPVKTVIGSFEGQLIIGRLEGSGFGPMEPNPIYFGTPIYLPKPDDWRFLSGLALTWQPKWVPGLFLGLTSSSQVYSKDVSARDYFPSLFPFKKIKSDDPLNKGDQLSSLFFRWLWPEEKAEIYFEYGLSNPSGNLRDFGTMPEDSRAYIFGLRKLLPFKGRSDEHLQISMELTQLQETSANSVRRAESWYVNPYIRHGYTNRGEPLGAGIGPGANLQSLDVSWVKGLKTLGLQLERYVHNNDYYYYAFEPSQDWRRHWVDISLAARGEWNYKNFIFNARLQAVQSFNYKWFLKQNPGDPYVVNGIDAFNIQSQIGLSYRF